MIFGLTRYADYIKDNISQLEAELASGRVEPGQAKEVLNALKEAEAMLQKLIAKVEDYVAQESASVQPEGEGQ
jgi:hypothetical protein